MLCLCLGFKFSCVEVFVWSFFPHLYIIILVSWCLFEFGPFKIAYSLHCSSFLGLPFRILNTEMVKPKKGTVCVV